MNDLTEIFGAPISIYTRAQAIEDGVLVQLPTDEALTPFKYPVAITVALWAEIERGAGKTDVMVRNGRIWDVGFMATLAARGVESNEVFYRCKIGRKTFALWCHYGPDDEGAPCITIGFPEDR